MRTIECRRVKVKRNMDLIRDILAHVEDDQELDGYHFKVFDTSDFPEHTEDEIAYHVDLLIQAGFLRGDGGNLDAPTATISALTWQGHEFIADTRDPGVWDSVKERTKGLPEVAIAAVWELAKAEIRKKLGLL
jgi:hypothetical protein